MGEGKQRKVTVYFQDGSKETFRFALNVGFNQVGSLEIDHPRDINGQVLIPYVTSGSSVKYMIIEDELIQQMPAGSIKLAG